MATVALLFGCSTHEKLKSNISSQHGKASIPVAVIAPSWTTNETECFWAAVASCATRTSTAPRMKVAEADKGEGMLAAFGTQYMPNAYDNYEKAREKAIEREQQFKENFPGGAKSDSTGGDLYRKICKATAKSVSEYFRRRDELCHFYLLNKAGIMTAGELADLDMSKICVMLPICGELAPLGAAPMQPTGAELDFARKYKPETFGAYERLTVLYEEGVKEYDELLADAEILDAVRGDGVLFPFRIRINEISKKLDAIANTLKQENLIYNAEEVSAEDLSLSDGKFGVEIRAFEKKLPIRDYAQRWFAKNWTAKEWGCVAYVEGVPFLGLQYTMVPIPGGKYAMCKYEVTQALWEAVMGENPSTTKGMDLPVDYVSYDDCLKFLAKLNALPEVKVSGLTYRMPTRLELVHASRAGTTGEYCRLVDGTEITENMLGEVAWFGNNSNRKLHPVGRKNPNAFGIHDIYGNVKEWTRIYQYNRIWYQGYGGNYKSFKGVCGVFEDPGLFHDDDRIDGTGFRLCCDWPPKKRF